MWIDTQIKCFFQKTKKKENIKLKNLNHNKFNRCIFFQTILRFGLKALFNKNDIMTGCSDDSVVNDIWIFLPQTIQY